MNTGLAFKKLGEVLRPKLRTQGVLLTVQWRVRGGSQWSTYDRMDSSFAVERVAMLNRDRYYEYQLAPASFRVIYDAVEDAA